MYGLILMQEFGGLSKNMKMTRFKFHDMLLFQLIQTVSCGFATVLVYFLGLYNVISVNIGCIYSIYAKGISNVFLLVL